MNKENVNSHYFAKTNYLCLNPMDPSNIIRMILVFANEISYLEEERILLHRNLTAALVVDTPRLLKLLIETESQSKSDYCYYNNPFYN